MNYIKKTRIEEALFKVKNALADLMPTDELKQEFWDKSFIAGGCIYSLYNHDEPNDYDFFLTNQDLADKLHSYFDGMVDPYGDIEDHKIKIGTYQNNKLIVTNNAISIGDYQIVTKWVGEPEDVVSQFDFKHNMCYYLNKELREYNNGFKYLEDDVLRYNEERARDICGTIMRIPKFASRGMKVHKVEVAKMLRKLEEKGFDDRELEILDNMGAY